VRLCKVMHKHAFCCCTHLLLCLSHAVGPCAGSTMALHPQACHLLSYNAGSE
jgi:hypothetical protein